MKRYTLKKDVRSAGSLIDYDQDLNEQQRAVVTAGSGPLLVIAGAGSGKTHTLTYRVAHLLERGVRPDRILLLTFTNKAARAMTDRVARLVTSEIEAIWSGTFHSIANRILRRYATRLGYPETYSIIDGEDAGILMTACMNDAGVDKLGKRFPRGSVMSSLMSFCINTQRRVEEVLEEKYPYFVGLEAPIREIFQLYQARKLEMGLMDFDDLLLNWKRLLVEFPGVREELTHRFEHVLVDEYQDTNHLQGELIDLMVGAHGNLMVVGDDCQSIYGFRGAEYRNILEFPERYPNCQQFRLETNYRSTPEILELTNRSIANNHKQFQKTLRAHRPQGELPALIRLRDVYQQGAFICQRILELADEGVSLNDIAVLYRAHHHAMELQVELAKRGIPYVVRSGVRFFEQAHIKDVLAYLRFLYNPKDELSFLRFAQHYRGIGTRRAQRLWSEIAAQPDPLAAACSQALAQTLPARAQRSWNEGRQTLDVLRRGRLTAPPSQLIDTIIGGPYASYLQNSFENVENRMGDLEQLSHYAGQYRDLDHFLGEISLMSSLAGQDIVVGGEKPDEYVTLSSIHQAKGLEWEACFVLWLSDGQFPSTNAGSTVEGMEEERRLFYVATTRARQDLYLCHVFTHQRRDGRRVLLRESPFILELEQPDPDDNPWESWLIE